MLPLVYFTHADLKSGEQIDASIAEVECTENSNKPKKKLKLSVCDESMNYEAQEEDESPYCIGICNRENGEISIIQTKFFVMKPSCFLKQNGDNDLDKDKPSFTDRLNSLTEAFGSSRKRKALHTKLKNKLDSQTLDQAADTAIQASVDNRNKLMASVDNEPTSTVPLSVVEQYAILPTPNKDASKPSEVYPIDSVSLTQNELDTLTLALATKFLSTTREITESWKAKQIYPEYIVNRLPSILNSKVQQLKLNKCKLLAYINFLIKLYQLKSAQLRSKQPMKAAEIPDQLIEKLLCMYTVVSANNAGGKSMRSMPRRLKDKLACHIMIVALHIDDFTCDLQSLQKDLKISIQRLIDYYLALGCHIKSHVTTVNNSKLIGKQAVLSLPLVDLSKIKPNKRNKRS
jgi:DNA-directed RNA polymerase I subunit RPA49